MPLSIGHTYDVADVAILHSRKAEKAFSKALKKAGGTALRDMKSESSKRVRARKALKAKTVRGAIRVVKPKTREIDAMSWEVNLRGDVVRVSDYPHRQTRRGVSAKINKGARTLLRGAFVATMPSGHRGVFVRRGAQRLPIEEPLASRPVDALLHPGEAQGVLVRGQRSLAAAVDRLLPIELEKLGG